MKKGIVFFLSFIAFLFCSCTMSISNPEYIEIARGYLIENFGGEYTFVSLKKTASENEVHVLFKSDKLENREVNVRVVISDQKIDTYTCHVSSNYPNILFEKEEADYYKNIFGNYFSDCNIVMNNSERFMDYYSKYWVSDEISGEWIEHETDELTFEQYISILIYSECKAYADIIVTEKKNRFLDSEDKLKCSLVDLQNSKLMLDGNFYIVDTIDDDYESNYNFKADINITAGNYNGFKYDYKVEKKES